MILNSRQKSRNIIARKNVTQRRCDDNNQIRSSQSWNVTQGNAAKLLTFAPHNEHISSVHNITSGR